MKKVRILMVCLGNICRSPMAEGILKSKLDDTIFLLTLLEQQHIILEINLIQEVLALEKKMVLI